MAEAVKNSNRKRRPPSHFHQGYNEDNYEPTHGQYNSSRATQSLKEQNRQTGEPFTINVMSKLLARFINMTNKKYSEMQIKKKQEQLLLLQKKTAVNKSNPTLRNDEVSKQQRQKASFKKKDASEGRDLTFRQQPPKQKNQQKSQKKIITSQSPMSSFQPKNSKAQIPQSETPKNLYPTQDLYSIQSMAKVSREQLLKFIPKGIDPSTFKNQLLHSINSTPLKSQSKSVQNIHKQPPRLNQFRQDNKLFKRASFHIGIAYNIHIQTIKQRNPNFTSEQLDPTYVSRNLKQLSSIDLKRKQEQYEKNIKLHQQVLRNQQKLLQQYQQQQHQQKNKLKQQQNNRLNGDKKNSTVNQNQKNNQSIVKNKQPVFIDLIDEQPQNQQPNNQNINSHTKQNKQQQMQNQQDYKQQVIQNNQELIEQQQQGKNNKKNSTEMKQEIQQLEQKQGQVKANLQKQGNTGQM